MRRKDKQITDHNKIEMFLKKGKILHIAMIDGNRPYLIPVNYGYRDNTIYIHSAREGKKIDLIKKITQFAFKQKLA